jgi:hypothetical protein
VRGHVASHALAAEVMNHAARKEAGRPVETAPELGILPGGSLSTDIVEHTFG